ncbi:pyridoxal phosphate-dependent aminotransferase family protein [Gillisia sp. M10.2A]|uniref:Pyridoxal phosphate-dependent aminotransferase family protein n=1 Tax=Gillisia lutea TaxID=2909668 RepID=A0ABS9EC44_9FLAO|nr:pyridoxal phosphate-dependent aminotransferase family protein [Gillisia lutea]MCF4100461.1 pyridoxal phosphate-dependent aminotransferase family protein [Gillisia lutea]
MRQLPLKLKKSLEKRKENNSFRSLSFSDESIDFYSNDYLGFSRSTEIASAARELVVKNEFFQNGATGSRLISGNHQLFEDAEKFIARFHNSETALIFNSGYDANLGFFSSVPQRGDIVFYDELSHASIRDGISLGKAHSYKFKHNDLGDLENKILLQLDKETSAHIYIVTESIFSMDGDIPNLPGLVKLSEKYSCYLIIDEAHALGVYGEKGEGLVQELRLENRIFARIMTFGKGLGCHGAAVLGSQDLQDYLINFSRSFIYSTGLPPHDVAIIYAAYHYLQESSGDFIESPLKQLKRNIGFFKKEISHYNLQTYFIASNSAIHSCVIPGNVKVKGIAEKLKSEGFNVKPILSPTVALGEERLRFCLHNFNTETEITSLIKLLARSLL